MARLRSQGKAAPIPEPKRWRKSRASTKTTSSLLSDGEPIIYAGGRSAQNTKSSREPTSSAHRRTRSHTDNQPFEILGPNTRRKRPVVDPEDQPAKRRHSGDAEGADEEEQPPLNHDLVEDDDDDESAPPGQDFFKNINKSILPDADQLHKLPELRPDDNAEHLSDNEGRAEIVVEMSQEGEGDVAEDDPEAEDEAVVETDAEIEDSHAVAGFDEASVAAEDREVPSTPEQQPTPTEQPEPAGQDDPDPTPDPSQLKPSQAKRKKRRQSRKAAYTESEYREPRAASPVLGSDPPRPRAGRPSGSKQPLLSKDDADVYEFSDDDGDSQREQHQGKEQRQRPAATAQAARSGRRAQSPATRSRVGQEKDAEANTAAESDDDYVDENPDGDEELDDEQNTEQESEDDTRPENESEPEEDGNTIDEDSLLIEAPKEDEPVETTKIKGKVVQKLVTVMALPGWMGKRKWERDIKLDAATANEDSEEARKDLKPLGRSKHILAQLHRLLKLCHGLPRAPLFDDQNQYFREHDAEFRALISKIQRLVNLYASSITDLIRSGDTPANQKTGRRSISRLYKDIIPMLVWLLRDTFLAGCDISKEKTQQAVKHTGEFTEFTLNLLKRIQGWIRRLCEVLLNWSEQNPPKEAGRSEQNPPKEAGRSEQNPPEEAGKEKDWQALSSAVKTATMEFDEAIDRIHRIRGESEERRRAIERDEAVKREREKREQQEKEARDQQLQRFIDGTQKTTVKSKEQKYLDENGWNYWEDYELLKCIRSSRHLDYSVLTEILEERSAAQIEQRAKELRDKIRRKYERGGQEPPLWCYELA